jgi:hypothetical protein
MQRLQSLLLSLLVSVAFLASTLAVCNSHIAATEHPDCAQCLVASSSRRGDGMPIHLPAGPHHCPDHSCVHLHMPFLMSKSMMLPSLMASWFLSLPLARYEREISSSILRPPQA